MKNNSILYTKDLSKSFFKNNKLVEAVKNVSINIDNDEILGIVGQSGCGKTTLLRSILQLSKVDNGKVFFKNREITSLSDKELIHVFRRYVRMVYQHPEASLNPGLKVNKIIEQPFVHYFPDQANISSQKSKELLEKMGLSSSYLNKYQHELSGGEKRRVALARALVTNPKLIFADEPLAGLDKVLQYRLLSLLINLKEQHKFALVMVSHDIDIMKDICDRIIVMKDGIFIEETIRNEGGITFSNNYSKKLMS